MRRRLMTGKAIDRPTAWRQRSVASRAFPRLLRWRGELIELPARAVAAAADWTESYRRFWEESVDRSGDYLEALQIRSTAGKEATQRESEHGPRKSSRRTSRR